MALTDDPLVFPMCYALECGRRPSRWPCPDHPGAPQPKPAFIVELLMGETATWCRCSSAFTDRALAVKVCEWKAAHLDGWAAARVARTFAWTTYDAEFAELYTPEGQPRRDL